ncbi:MAG: DegT/DnrJ/EryC1/StrS family aminotransferase [Candidatus Accumulibacter sp.]|jgi:dTDP-4-amino-4,6-dideoxygalactose transaminase|nr:DegT/DnrJ/EryC1/StrS family aminotransferase [Accumulibacter sp.]
MPPTAGLPLPWRDLFGAGGDFAAAAREYLGAPRGGLASSGTACLVLILTALHRLSGRRTVIVPAWTCPLMALAVAHCGLSLRLCDLAENRLDFDPEALAALCDGETLAIVPTHLAGRVADVETARRIAQKHGAFVVEDAAQAFGARRDGRSVGLDGDAGFFSFAAGKGLSLYEGGLWVTRDAALAAEIGRTANEILARGGWREFWRCLELAAYALFYRPACLPWVYGLPLRRALKKGDLPAAVGDVFPSAIPLHRVSRWRRGVGRRSLARLRDFQRQTAERAQGRLAALDALPGLRVFRDAAGEEGVWPFFLLVLPDEKKRDDALEILWRAGLGVTRLFIHALPDYGYLRHRVPREDACRRARDLAARSLTVTNSPWLSDADFGRITAVLQKTLA